MTRKSQATQTSRTHFEQIPVEVVKKIVPAAEILEKGRIRTDSAAVESASRRTRSSAAAGHFHGVQFYSDSDALCRIVGGFISEGLEQRTPAIMIATPDHAKRIESCLRSRGTDVDALKELGLLVAFDARETLELFMVDGMPNSSAFRATVRTILKQVRHGREHCPIRAYGEMVDLLWKDGREAAAIRLETLWNQLGSTDDFELLCGYSMGNFYKGASIEEIKSQHTHLMTDDGHAVIVAAAG